MRSGAEVYRHLADKFKLLAHPARLRIMDELRSQEACVCHLQAVLKRPQAYISQQLRVLREADVVDTRQDGLNVFYHLTDSQIEMVLNAVLGPAQGPHVVPSCPCPKCQTLRLASLREGE
jgi:ArsR family transcriptional regulator